VSEDDPSFLIFGPERRFLLATSEGLTAETASVSSFAIDSSTGALTFLSRQPTEGGEPCHLCLDPTGTFVLVANHENGSVAVFPLDANGRLGPRTDLLQHVGSGPGPTQQGPHAHHVTFDPAGERVLVTDKGIDHVVVYRLNTTTGKLEPNEHPHGRIHAGAAPRHLAFGSGGEFVYVNGEADMTLVACEYDPATGELREIQSVSTLPEGATGGGWSTAEVAVAPSGRHVYVSNRGHDSIACFAVDSATGRLSPAVHISTGGRVPRHFGIHPSGRWLYAANQESDSIVQFDIDPDTGTLTPTGQVTAVGSPVCILFS
jgi:6-phosphogluconolactonase